ncbi:MAG: hypothetical protein ABEJ95_00735 [Candidatus Nanohalobium sp.]
MGARVPEKLKQYVKETVEEDVFDNESEFLRFAIQDTLKRYQDDLGVDDKDVFDSDYHVKKELLEEADEEFYEDVREVLEPSGSGEVRTAVDMIYGGYIMENERMVEEGVYRLASQIDSDIEEQDSDICEYVETALDDVRKRLE